MVDGWDDGEEVLEFEEVIGRGGDGAVEGIVQVRVVWPEGELIDDM